MAADKIDRLSEVRKEHQADLKLATEFYEACQSGDAECLRLSAWKIIDKGGVDAWRLAMRKAARLTKVHPDVQEAFLDLWTEHKMLPFSVGDRPLMAAALRVLLPSRKKPP